VTDKEIFNEVIQEGGMINPYFGQILENGIDFVPYIGKLVQTVKINRLLYRTLQQILYYHPNISVKGFSQLSFRICLKNMKMQK
jgi:hypothetical protein